jgi:hypothetical protein
MIAGTDNKPFRAPQHSTLARANGLGRLHPAFTSATSRVQGVSAWLCYSIGFFYLTMLVREPVHGMQGL